MLKENSKREEHKELLRDSLGGRHSLSSQYQNKTDEKSVQQPVQQHLSQQEIQKSSQFL
jgi:hypothetical protein